VSALKLLGLKAAFLNSSLSSDEARVIERQMVKGDLDLVYIAPERLLMDRTLNLLRNTKDRSVCYR